MENAIKEIQAAITRILRLLKKAEKRADYIFMFFIAAFILFLVAVTLIWVGSYLSIELLPLCENSGQKGLARQLRCAWLGQIITRLLDGVGL